VGRTISAAVVQDERASPSRTIQAFPEDAEISMGCPGRFPVAVEYKVLDGIPMPLNTRFAGIQRDLCQKRHQKRCIRSSTLENLSFLNIGKKTTNPFRYNLAVSEKKGAAPRCAPLRLVFTGAE
jgi:hypothetical protein